MANALGGFGVDVLRNGVSIAELVDVGPPKLGRKSIETTHHKSPGMWQEFMKGLKDAGEFTMTINYNPPDVTHNASTGLLNDFNDNTSIDRYDIIFPDAAATTWTVYAFTTSFEPKTPIDDRITADLTLKITGQPTLV